MKVVVADSGPLIVLAQVGLLDALRQVAGEVLVPRTVFTECTQYRNRPGAVELLAAESAGLIRLHADGDAPALRDVPTLDAGEKSALGLALELNATVLMDERLGRQMAALHGIPVIGSVGVLLAAKQRGLLPAIAPILDRWQAHGYFLSESLKAAALARAGEA